MQKLLLAVRHRFSRKDQSAASRQSIDLVGSETAIVFGSLGFRVISASAPGDVYALLNNLVAFNVAAMLQTAAGRRLLLREIIKDLDAQAEMSERLQDRQGFNEISDSVIASFAQLGISRLDTRHGELDA